MKHVLWIVLLPTIALAQTLAPAPTPESNDGVKFVSDTAFYQLTGGKQATVFTARVPVTRRFSGMFSQWLIPTAKGNISEGGVEFREILAHILKAKGTNLDLKKFEVFARGMIGSEIDAANNRNFAYSFEGGIEFPIGTVAGGVVKTGVRFGFLGVPGSNEHFQLNGQGTISPQISWNR